MAKPQEMPKISHNVTSGPYKKIQGRPRMPLVSHNAGGGETMKACVFGPMSDTSKKLANSLASRSFAVGGFQTAQPLEQNQKATEETIETDPRNVQRPMEEIRWDMQKALALSQLK